MINYAEMSDYERGERFREAVRVAAGFSRLGITGEGTVTEADAQVGLDVIGMGYNRPPDLVSLIIAAATNSLEPERERIGPLRQFGEF